MSEFAFCDQRSMKAKANFCVVIQNFERVRVKITKIDH